MIEKPQKRRHEEKEVDEWTDRCASCNKVVVLIGCASVPAVKMMLLMLMMLNNCPTCPAVSTIMLMLRIFNNLSIRPAVKAMMTMLVILISCLNRPDGLAEKKPAR